LTLQYLGGVLARRQDDCRHLGGEPDQQVIGPDGGVASGLVAVEGDRDPGSTQINYGV